MPARLSLLARVCALLVLATLVAATPAHATFSMGKLHAGTAAGPENYVTTPGDTLVPEGVVDSNKWHRFVVTDAGGVVRAQTACTANPAGGGAVTGETSYTVPPSAAATTTTGWRYQLQQFPTSACSGAPSTKQLYFTVARLTAYTTSALTTATTAIGPGSSAYIRVAGLGKVKGAPAVAAETDWSTTWIKPDGTTSCANTAGKDERAPSAANGIFPTVATDFLQYRPNTTSVGALWNREPLYETKPCASTATHGQWKVKLLKDATHFVTLNAFLVTPLTATSIDSAPATPGGDRHPAWSFSGGGGVGHECRLRSDDGSVLYDWAPCAGTASYDLTAQPEGEYEFAVHSIAGADLGPDAISTYLLDTTPPAAPSIDQAPVTPSTDPAATWSFSGELGAALDCRLDRDGSQVADWAPCADSQSYDLSTELDGDYTFSVRATDGAGHVSPITTSDYVLDRTGPGAPVLTAHQLSTDNEPQAAWDLSAEPGAAIECRLDRGITVISDWAPCVTTASYDLSAQSDGTYTFSARATDALGNVGAPVVTTYTLDRSAPAAPSFTAAPTSPGQGSAPQWSYTAEGGAGLECRLQRNGATVDDWASCTSPDTRTLGADGTYVLAVRATDAAGNTGPAASSTYVLDRVAPNAPAITSAPATPGYDPTVAWGFSGEAGATFDCRVDRGATQISGWAPCSSPRDVDLTAQTDGTYTFSVRATDAAGNTSTSTTSDYALDRAAPAAPVITAHPLAADDDPLPSWTADGEPGTALQCRLERGVTVISDWTVCSGPTGYDLSAAPDGTYTYSARAVDAAGNIGAPVQSAYVLDRVAPATPAITSAPASPSPDATVAWSFTGEPGATYSCRIARGATAIADWGPCTSPDAIDLTAEIDGTYTFSVQATDAAGNASGVATSSFVLDRAAPGAATITAAPASPGNDPTVAWSFTGDPGTTFDCRVDRGATQISGWASCSSPAPVDLTSAGDGTYTFSVRAKDGANNYGTPATSTYVLDTGAPSVPAITSHPLAADDDPRPAWGLSTDPGTALECRLERGVTVVSDWSVCTSPAGFDLTGQPDGTYTFTARAVDDAGNRSGDRIATYTLDRSAPAAPSFTGEPASPGKVATPQWTYTAEGGASLECRLQRDGATVDDWASCASPDTRTLGADGTYVLAVRATDAAGNTGAASASTYVLDRAAPGAPSITSAPATPGNDPTVAFGFSGEAGASFTCRVDRGATPISAWGPCTSAAPVDLTGAGDGTYTFSVRATDAAGNTGTAATADYTLDTGAPSPPSITGHPLIDDNDPTPTWTTSAPDPGSALQCRLERGVTVVSDWALCTGAATYDLAGEIDGTYVFSVRAVDDSGNLGGATTSTYRLDRVAPATPSFTADPTSPGRSVHPSWSFTGEDGAGFDCRVLQGATVVIGWASCSSPHAPDLGALADGVYTLAVRATDAAGNSSAAATATYELDTTGPDAPSLDAEPPATGANTTPAWQVSTDETGATLECRTERNGTLLADWATCTSPHTENLTTLGDATYTVSFRARDVAGNAGASAVSTYVLDTSAAARPSIDAHPSSPGADDTPTWAFSGQPGETFDCRLDAGATVVADWAPCASSRTYDVSARADGSYTFSVRASDGAGNTSPSATSSYVLDRTGPDAPSISGGPAALARTTTPSWTFTGEAGASFTCRLIRETVVVSDWTACAGSRAYDLTGQPDGAYTFAVRATDALGNAGAAASSTYVLDTTGGAAPLIAGRPGSPGFDRAPSWTFSGAPGEIFECRLDRGTTLIADWAACTSPQRYDLTGAPDAGYTFMVRALDAVGNAGVVAAAAYDLDTTPPGPVKLTGAPAARDKDPRPEWSFRGEGGTLECRVARGATTLADWATCTSPKRLDLRSQPDGDYTLLVREQDAAGNRGAAVTGRYRLDTAPPAAPQVAAPVLRSDDDRRTMSFAFSADEDDASFECRLVHAGTLVSDWAACTSPRVYDVTASGEGDYDFAVRATDDAGNTSPSGLESYALASHAPADAPGTPAGAAAAPAASAAAKTAARRAARPESEPTPAEDRQPAAPAPAPERSARHAAAHSPSTPPRHRRAARHEERHGAKKVAHAAAAAAAAVARTVQQAAQVAAENADKSVFPGSLIFIVIGFLGVQGRIDRSDPKLSLVSAAADQEVTFGPPPTLR